MTVVERIKADESKAARYGRAFLLWLSTVALQVVPDIDAAANWSAKRWALGFGLAALTGCAGLLSVGQKNPTPAP